jgi:sugar phosphate isomerase/epimerase
LDTEQREYSCQEILRASEAAAKLEVRHFVIHPGPEKSFNDIAAWEYIQRIKNAGAVLNRVAQHCSELGIGFVLENMLPHLLFGNSSDMLWIMGSIEKVNVGTCLDTGHAYLSSDLNRVMFKLTGHLQLIHANDNRGNRDDHLPPGKGDIDWSRLLTELSKTHFNGGFILELAGDSDQDAHSLLADARYARRFLRDISRHIELSTPPTVPGVKIEE